MVPVPTVEPLTAENMLWANTVLAAGSAIGFVVYTGAETRAVMNTSHPKTKVGLLDIEINRLAKVQSDLRQWFESVSCIPPCPLDFMCGHLRSIACASRSQWLPRTVVRICLQILDLVLVHHPDQVSVKPFRLGVTFTYATFRQPPGKLGYGKDGICIPDHE